MFQFHDRDLLGKRRAFLKFGTSSIAGLGLAPLLGKVAASDESLTNGRSVIFLFLHGGPSQFETFDPKMQAPEGIRSATGEIATNIPGITFGSSFPSCVTLRIFATRSATSRTSAA